jgi:D-alanine-D-alanine ligase-like ATP-grasp enzyme
VAAAADAEIGNLEGLTPTSKIIIDEAQSRDIEVEMKVPDKGLFTLHLGKKSIECASSLTELSSVVSSLICIDKQLTNKLLKGAGLSVPDQVMASTKKKNSLFFKKHQKVVTKPLDESLGTGVSVDLRSIVEMEEAINVLKMGGKKEILIEECCEGLYVRILLFDFKFVAAVHHALPTITGNGKHIIEQLIVDANLQKTSWNQIPIDRETERCVNAMDYEMNEILPLGETLTVRKNSNEHTGAVPKDVTDEITPFIKSIAEKVAKEINIPVVGIDFLLKSFTGDDYVIIEANSRPALVGHGDQPIAKKFLDYLFPETKKN